MNNLKLGEYLRYQDVRELQDGSWICWYYAEVNMGLMVSKAKMK